MYMNIIKRSVRIRDSSKYAASWGVSKIVQLFSCPPKLRLASCGLENQLFSVYCWFVLWGK